MSLQRDKLQMDVYSQLEGVYALTCNCSFALLFQWQTAKDGLQRRHVVALAAEDNLHQEITHVGTRINDLLTLNAKRIAILIASKPLSEAFYCKLATFMHDIC